MDLNCPYCGAELEVCHDDGFGYKEGVAHQMQCDECDKHFVFRTEISFSYEPDKADCLNGVDHDWQPTQTQPKEFTVMRCSMCDDERDLTDAERQSMNIGTPKQYFDRLQSENEKT